MQIRPNVFYFHEFCDIVKIGGDGNEAGIQPPAAAGADEGFPYAVGYTHGAF